MKIEILRFNDLTQVQQDDMPNNGGGKEWANYIKVSDGNLLVALQSDAMEPEDATFGRDLSWIASLLQKVYDLDR